MNNSFTYLIAFLLLLISFSLEAQDLEKRYSFAKSYFGADFIYSPTNETSSYLDANGNRVEFNRNSFLTPAINLGATHFWGYADFYISITTRPIQLGGDDQEIETSTRFGAMTGLRLYPLRLKENRISPFIGYKFSPIRYRQENIEKEEYKTTQTKSMFDVGVGYQTKKMYFYAGYTAVLNPETDIYLSRETSGTTNYTRGFFNIGVNWTLENTRGAYDKATQKLDTLLNNKNMLGFFGGIGISSAFPTINSSYVNEYYPFLDDRAMPAIFPDIALGYHFSKQNFTIAAAFRPIRQVREAFSFKQVISKTSLVLETYKYLGDYHGFAPFLGVGASYDRLNLKETDEGTQITNTNYEEITPSIIFGWDISPAFGAEYWLLRTNLRYNPSLKIENRNETLSLQYIEFNFIQFVFYPQRYSMYKRLR